MSTPVNFGNGLITEIQMQKRELEVMTDAIESLPDDALMVEWGSGGSTIHWLQLLKPTQKLISIEHNKQWYDKVSKAIEIEWPEGKDNFTYIFQREKYGFQHGYATPTEEHPFGLDEYLYPCEEIWNADLFFIDGIARAACALYVMLQHVKDEPLIFLHDYVGRENWYHWSLQMFDRETFNDEKNYSTLVQLRL